MSVILSYFPPAFAFALDLEWEGEGGWTMSHAVAAIRVWGVLRVSYLFDDSIGGGEMR